MTRLLYLPDDVTVIQLEVDLTPGQLVAAVNAGMRPVPVLRSATAGKLIASQVNATVIIAPERSQGPQARKSVKPDLTRRQSQVLELSSRGFTTLEIAGMLDISRRAVNYHLNQVKHRIRGQVTKPHETITDDNEIGL
jgi:DNA-binding CsgD family transcriptional regulator